MWNNNRHMVQIRHLSDKLQEWRFGNGNTKSVLSEDASVPCGFHQINPKFGLVICKIPRHLLLPCQLLLTNSLLLQLLHCLASYTGLSGRHLQTSTTSSHSLQLCSSTVHPAEIENRQVLLCSFKFQLLMSCIFFSFSHFNLAPGLESLVSPGIDSLTLKK